MRLQFFGTLALVALLLGSAGVGAVAADGGNSTANATATDNGGEFSKERVLSIVNNWDPSLASTETVRRVESWVASNGGALSESQRTAARSWLEQAKQGRDLSTATATETTATPASRTAGSKDWQESGATISSTVTLERWRVADSGALVIVLRSDGPERVMLSDVGQMMAAAEQGEGVSELNARGVTLSGGSNTVRFEATEHDGEMFVTVADGDSGVQISTGATGGGALAGLRTVSAPMGFVLGSLVMLSWFVIAALFTLRREQSVVITAGERYSA